MVADGEPTHAVVVGDGGCGKTNWAATGWQTKQNRTPIPEEVLWREDWLTRSVSFFGARGLWLSEIEADDLIATFIREAEGRGMEAVIAANVKI